MRDTGRETLSVRRIVKAGMAVVGVVAVAAALTSCGAGTTGSADFVTRSGARLKGTVSNTVVGDTTWYFEYGLNPSYGSTTPVQTLAATMADHEYPVSATVTGLAEATDYYYRLCAFDVDGHGACGANQRVRTRPTPTWDAVDGEGYVVDDAAHGVRIGAVMSSNAYDPEYEYGEVRVETGPPASADGGQASCLSVVGNRAAMGSPTSDYTKGIVVFVEDNGPTGDRWGWILLDAPPATCPSPTAYDFPPFVVGSTVIPAVVTSGDFVVHDEP